MARLCDVPRLLAAVIITVLPLGGMAQDSDPALKAGIIGVWHGEYNWTDERNPQNWLQAHGQDDYSPDGTVAGFIIYIYPDREDRMDYKAKWDIENGYLLTEIVDVRHGYLAVGSKSKDKILSLSDSTMELRAEDGKQIVLHREKMESSPSTGNGGR